jgi:hypothetical protein
MMVSSRELQRILIKHFNHEPKCCVCNTTNNLTIDHIYPKGLGGLDNVLNMRIMCSDHNENKSSYIDYSFDYVSVVTLDTFFLSRIVKRNNHLSRNYINTIIKNCIGKKAFERINVVSLKDYDYFVEFLKLYGIKVKIKPTTRLIPKHNVKFLTELTLNYVISKQAILNYFI